MSEVVAPSEAIRQFGARHAAQAAAITTGAVGDQAADIAALVAMVGPIGLPNIVPAAAQALATHVCSAMQLAGVHAAAAAAADRSAGLYEQTDNGSANGFQVGI
jgi:hypothetical protein